MKKQLSKKDIEEINHQIGFDCISKKDDVKLLDDKFVLVNNSVMFFYYDGKIAPTLKLLQQNNYLKKITVDMGAVKFVIKGADIMRPGITEIEDSIKKEEIISIIDANNKKPLAIGIALFSAEELKQMSSGRVIKNIHFVGDDIWKMQII